MQEKQTGLTSPYLQMEVWSLGAGWVGDASRTDTRFAISLDGGVKLGPGPRE